MPRNPQTAALKPKKSLGQHFLTDGRVVGRILHAAEVSEKDHVVEVGPGRGILTRALAARAKRVVAVEMDEELADRLTFEFQAIDSVTVVTGDARELDVNALVSPETSYKVVANLPYYAASPIVRRFLEASHKPSLMVFMVQREVARSMAASPGDMSLLSVAVQLYGRPRIVSYVPPRAFRPAPKVTSAIVRIDVFTKPAVAVERPEDFFDVVRAGFSAPRKQLRNSLTHGLAISSEAVEGLLRQADIDPRRRAETLSLEEWDLLYRAHRAQVS